MKLSFRQTLFGLGVLGLLALFAALDPRTGPQPLAAAPAATQPPDRPLDRVPADAGLFAHLSAGNLWDNPTVAELRKAYAKELDPALQALEKETGLRPEQINSLTFHYPKIPQGPGDEQLLVLQVTTKKPYDKKTLLAGARPKGEEAKGDVIKLRDNMVVHLTSETQFTVLHESLLEDFKKGPPKAVEGVMSEPIKAARAGKNAFVVGLDLSRPKRSSPRLPELQPFIRCSSRRRSSFRPTRTG